jgi:hypothetical protein
MAVEWKCFRGQWQNSVKATNIDKEDPNQQAAIFLACVGGDAYDIYSTCHGNLKAKITEKPDKRIEAFERHCIGKVNEIYERYVLSKRQ